jgi:hypothetical protein
MIEIISFDENGVTTKSFDELSQDEKNDLVLFASEAKLLCNQCYEVIPDGSGGYCEKHRA